LENINYTGEHLWAGNLGNGFVVLSFVASFVALLSFYLSFKNENYLRYARVAFQLHALAVVGIASTLFYMLLNHFLSTSMFGTQQQKHGYEIHPVVLLEGQEGSFLLWTFWNMILGLY
jgi:cytochrome c-type biogenesis protein CcmF